MEIQKVTDTAFAKYGKVMSDIPVERILKEMEHTPLPEDVIYVPSVEALEVLPDAVAVREKGFGGLPIQIGYCNGSNVKLNALVPAGTAVELYATTLHYAPCNAKAGGFRCVVVLPKGTNEALPFAPEAKGESRLLTAVNKWLIAHEDAEIEGAVNGLKGENITIV